MKKLGFANAYEMEKEVEKYTEKEILGELNFGEIMKMELLTYNYYGHNPSFREEPWMRIQDCSGGSEDYYSIDIELVDLAFNEKNERIYTIEMDFDRDEYTNGKFILESFQIKVTDK